MNKTSKVIVTVIVVVLFLVLSFVINGLRTDAGFRTPGIFGLILLAAFIGSLRAIWKSKDDCNNNTLQK